jgi:hypothetical protein
MKLILKEKDKLWITFQNCSSLIICVSNSKCFIISDIWLLLYLIINFKYFFFNSFLTFFHLIYTPSLISGFKQTSLKTRATHFHWFIDFYSIFKFVIILTLKFIYCIFLYLFLFLIFYCWHGLFLDKT